jgi:chromosome segregation ATPase
MFNKKVIILVLIIVLSVAVIFVLGTMLQEKNRLNQEIVDLQAKGKDLDVKLLDMGQENKRFKEKVASLNADLEKLTTEKTDAQGKYDIITMERDRLAAQIGQLNNKLAVEKDKVQEIASLQKEKKLLSAQLQDIEQENKEAKEKAASLNADMESLIAEKTGFQEKYDVVSMERDNLMAQIKQLNNELASEGKEKVVTGKARSPKQEPPSATPQDEYYWAELLKKKTELELQLENVGNELKTAKLNNEQLQSNINLLGRDNEKLKGEIEYNKKMVDKLSLEVTRERKDRLQIQESLKSLKSENESFREKIGDISARKVELEESVKDLSSRNSELEASLTKMETFVKQKLSQIDGLMEDLDINQKDSEQRQNQVQERQVQQNRVGEKPESAEPKRGSVQLQPIIVRPQGGRFKKEAPTRKASVLLINKANNFAIINLGETAGIKIGDSLRVYNSRREVIANLAVISVRENISACDIKPQNAPIAVGDSVNFK